MFFHFVEFSFWDTRYQCQKNNIHTTTQLLTYYLHVLRNMSYLDFDWICSLRKNDILHFVIWVLWCERKIEFDCVFIRNSSLCLKVFYLLVKKITTYSIWLLSNGNKSRGPYFGKYYPDMVISFFDLLIVNIVLFASEMLKLVLVFVIFVKNESVLRF